jgi:hypothetical protein
MRLLFQGSCRKDPSENDVNEDRWAFSRLRGTLALCDGASESYDSSVWAQILSDKFVLDPTVTPEWLTDAVAEYVSRHDFDAMSWSQQASYKRGTFSTLLGVRHDATGGAVEVLAVGDSLAVLADGCAVVSYWPYSKPQRFREHPTLLATLTEHNGFVSEVASFAARVARFDLGTLEKPRLLCVTDALGEWLLRQAQYGGDGLERLLAISSQEELEDLIARERMASRIKIDDSTLIVASFDEGLEANGLPHT